MRMSMTPQPSRGRIVRPGGPDALTPEALLVSMRDSNISNMIVAFLRLATSAEIGARSDFFCPFVMVRFSFPLHLCHDAL